MTTLAVGDVMVDPEFHLLRASTDKSAFQPRFRNDSQSWPGPLTLSTLLPCPTSRRDSSCYTLKADPIVTNNKERLNSIMEFNQAFSSSIDPLS